MNARADRVELLPAEMGSLARGLPQATSGTVFVLGSRGGIRVPPEHDFTVVFGRNEPEVHVCVGEDDPGVSREHGAVFHDGRGWMLRNTGGLPIRLPGSTLLLSGHQQALPVAYTPLFIRTAPGREHLLEIRVAGSATPATTSRRDEKTRRPVIWSVGDEERLVLVVLGQRYLRHEAHPAPLTWGTVAEELNEGPGTKRWTAKKVEWTVREVRSRLIDRGVPGLTREEVGEPVGNALNHNLITELLLTGTLVPPDLRLLDDGAA